MAKINWTMNETVQPADMNALGTEINELRSDVDNIQIPDGTLTQKGIVQLSDVVTSTDKTKAATANSVKLAFDEATAAKQLGVEQKNNVVAALNSIGVTASTSETWTQLITKMSAIIRATGNATAAQVLSGATFSNASANGLTGTMANRGSGGTVTPGTANQTKAAGYYSSAITILGDADLVAANIRSGVDLFGVVGTLVEGKQVAIGSGTVVTNVLTVTGLPFAPRNIIVQRANFSTNTAIYSADLSINKFAQNGLADNYNVFTTGSGGFTVTLKDMSGTTFNYIAFSA